jgi:hypothetical protein
MMNYLIDNPNLNKMWDKAINWATETEEKYEKIAAMTKMVLDRVNVLLASGNLPTPDDLSDPNEGGPPSLFHGT